MIMHDNDNDDDNNNNIFLQDRSVPTNTNYVQSGRGTDNVIRLLTICWQCVLKAVITVARVRTKIKTANIGRMKDFVPKDLTTCFVNAKYLVRFAFQVGIFRHHVHQPLYIYIYIYINLYFFAVHYTVITSSCSSHSIGVFILFQSVWTNITAAMLGQHTVSANVSRGTWPSTAQRRAILAARL